MYTISKDKKNKQRVYYNISIPHNDLISIAGSPTPATFSEVRDSPLFNGKPNDWNMSVVRFTVPTSYIPIQFFPVEEDTIIPTNPNKSIYSITMSYLGVDYQVFLEWVTQDNGVPIPPPPLGSTARDYQYNPNYLAYYSLYSYNHFCTILNTAMSTCFTTNILPLLPAPPPGTSYASPYISFDGKTKLFTLYTQNIFLDTEVNPINIYFNTYLNENFDTSFDVVYNSYTEPDGKNVRYVILDRGDNKIIDSTAPNGFIYSQSQEFETTGQMTSFTSLVIRSNSLPIINEVLSLQPRAGQLNGSGIGGGSESIISDFEVDLGTAQNLKNFVHYLPTAEYRRITMQGNTPIQRIDVEILWKDNYDNLYPVLIPPHDIATIKILFEEN